MVISAVCALLLSAALFVLIRKLRAAALLPVCPGDKESLTVMLLSEGNDTALERTVNGLLWLRENGTLPASIVIVDGGMTAEVYRLAQLLEKQHDCISLRTNTEDGPWENRNT